MWCLPAVQIDFTLNDSFSSLRIHTADPEETFAGKILGRKVSDAQALRELAPVFAISMHRRSGLGANHCIYTFRIDFLKE